MMTKRSAFEQVGGMTEDLAVAFNDLDYCLKLRELDYLVVYTPEVELYTTSLCRGDLRIRLRRWADWLAGPRTRCPGPQGSCLSSPRMRLQGERHFEPA